MYTHIVRYEPMFNPLYPGCVNTKTSGWYVEVFKDEELVYTTPTYGVPITTLTGDKLSSRLQAVKNAERWITQQKQKEKLTPYIQLVKG